MSDSFEFGPASCVDLGFGGVKTSMIATETTMLSGSKLKIKFSCKRVEAELGKTVGSDGGKVIVDFENTMSAKKRGPPGDLEAPGEKKLKMDRKLKSQCSTILSMLISHKDSWAFRTPVDPVKLQIPDYFDVVSSPMDLGTVKSKLDRNLYCGAGEFASDVRLTFSNAMLYNPPGNPFHQVAEDLNAKFEMKWNLLDVKRSHGSSKVEERGNLSGQIKKITQINDTKLNSHVCTPVQSVSVTRSSVPCSENGGTGLGASYGEVKLSKKVKIFTSKESEKNIDRGYDNGSGQSSCANVVEQLPSLDGSKCRTCCNVTCQCSLGTENHFSDISSRSSVGKEQNRHLTSANVPGLDCQAKCSPTSHMCKSDPESDGAVSCLDEETLCTTSHLTSPARDATSGEEWSTAIFSVPLSPKKALRAAMLKSRFADTILKAQQKSLLDQGYIIDPLKMQQEMARLERKQRQEKARIEAEIRAAEAAAQRQTELKWKERQEREREEARIALEKVERTVVFEQNCSILEELKKLAGYHTGSWGSHFRSPLERLGLFFKDECTLDADESAEGEEGEIC